MARPVRVAFETGLTRRRLAVLLRLPLAIPALAVFCAWSVVAVPAHLVSWPVVVARGRLPRRFQRFLCAYLRYSVQLGAWLTLVTRRYPTLRRRRPQPVEVVADREPQPRLTALLRPVLALPGLVLGSVFGVVLAAAAIAAWFVALVRGRTTEGLRELGAFCLRYQTEVVAYVLLLTPRAPRLAPPPADYES